MRVGVGEETPLTIFILVMRKVPSECYHVGSDRGGKNYSLRVYCAQLLGRAYVAMWSRSLQKGICLELLQKVANILKYSFLLFPFREGKNKVTTFSCSQQIRNPVNQLTICSKGNIWFLIMGFKKRYPPETWNFSFSFKLTWSFCIIFSHQREVWMPCLISLPICFPTDKEVLLFGRGK